MNSSECSCSIEVVAKLCLRIIEVIQSLGTSFVELSPLFNGESPVFGYLINLLHIVYDDVEMSSLMAQLKHPLEHHSLSS
jgi:hypothetical protein